MLFIYITVYLLQDFHCRILSLISDIYPYQVTMLEENETWPMIILESLKTFLLLIYYCLYGAIRAMLPASILPKKSVHGEIVLITGEFYYKLSD